MTANWKSLGEAVYEIWLGEGASAGLALSTADWHAAGRLAGVLEGNGVACELRAAVEPSSLNGSDIAADIMGCSAGDMELCDVEDPQRGWRHVLRPKQRERYQKPHEPLAVLLYDKGGPNPRGPAERRMYRWELTPAGVEWAAENMEYPEPVVAAMRKRWCGA